MKSLMSASSSTIRTHGTGCLPGGNRSRSWVRLRSSVSRRTLEAGAFVTAPAAGRANARPSSERYRLADLTSSVNAHESLLDIADAPAVLAVLELDVHPFAGLVEDPQPCPDRKLAERSKRHVRPKEDRRCRRRHRVWAVAVRHWRPSRILARCAVRSAQWA